jgi:hypothetical protein
MFAANPNKMAAKKYLTSLFDSKVTYNYVISTLRPGRFHVYTGSGNAGWNLFVNHLIGALAHMRPWSISTPDLLTTPLSNLKNASLLIASNWDERTAIPVDRMLELLRAGHLVVLCSPSAPHLSHESNELKGATTVHAFQDHENNLLFNDQPNEALVADALLEDIIFAREAVFSKPPAKMTNALAELSPLQEIRNKVVYAPEDAEVPPAKKASEIHITMNYADPSSKSSDSLTIAVDPHSNGFLVTLQQPYTKSSATINLACEGLFDYLERYFTAAPYSILSYETVVFNVPIFPQVTLRLSGVKDYLEELQDQVEWLCEDWPLE